MCERNARQKGELQYNLLYVYLRHRWKTERHLPFFLLGHSGSCGSRKLRTISGKKRSMRNCHTSVWINLNRNTREAHLNTYSIEFKFKLCHPITEVSSESVHPNMNWLQPCVCCWKLFPTVCKHRRQKKTPEFHYGSTMILYQS